MSDIDLSSLESNIKTETGNYTDIEDVYGIELFTKENNIFSKVDESKLFSNNTKNQDFDTTKLFAKVEDANANSEGDNQINLGIDLSIIIMVVVMICLIILLFRRFTKNEYTY